MIASAGGFIRSTAAANDGNNEKEWAQARPLLRPKLLPSYFVDAFPGLIHSPFSGRLVTAYSIDRGQTDEYVRSAEFDRWAVSLGTLHAQALDNLAALSQDLPAATKQLPHGAAIFISKGDGYDAARILLPELRARVLTVLGSRAFAAVPARDLLMFWSSDDPKRHQLERQVEKEWTERPHALSKETFLVTASLVSLAPADEVLR